MIDGGTMISLLVRNHEFARFRRVTLPTSRTLRAIYWHAVLKESNPLQSERNFDAQLVRRRPTAKKDLRGTPVTSLRGDVERRHRHGDWSLAFLANPSWRWAFSGPIARRNFSRFATGCSL